METGIMHVKTTYHFGLAALTLVLVTASQAQGGAADVVACRAIADRDQRLDCFDRTSKQLDDDLRAQRSSDFFGLSGLFSGTGPKAESEFGQAPEKSAPKTANDGKAAIPDVAGVESDLVSVGDENGHAIFYLANGQVWRAQDGGRPTLKGDGKDHVRITRSALGLGYSLYLNDRSRGLSVTRVK